MPTTSIKLPDDLKAHAVVAAKIRGVTPHAFMLEAIREAVTATEQRAQFVADAEVAEAQMLDSGNGYTAQDVHKYLRGMASGTAKRRPKAKSWRG